MLMIFQLFIPSHAGIFFIILMRLRHTQAFYPWLTIAYNMIVEISFPSL